MFLFFFILFFLICLLLGGKEENSGFSGPVGRQASAGQISAFVRPAHHMAGEKGAGGWRGRGGVWEHLLHSSVIALLSSHSHSLMPTVHGFLSIRGLKGLHLRFFETVCQPIACNYKEWRKAVQRQHQHLYLALSWQPVTRFLFLPLTRKLGKQLPY